MRILQVVGCMNMGGLETFVMNVFRNIDHSKVQFDFLYITDEHCFYDDEIEKLGGRIFRITGRYENLKKHCSELRKFIKNNKDINAVHIHAVSAFCLLDAMIIKEAGIDNIIVHSHASLAPHKLLNDMMKQILPFCTKKMIACSDKAAAWLYSRHCQGNVIVLPNGVDVQKYTYDSKVASEVRKELGLSDKFIIGHVGRMTEVKNHTFLLKVFSQIKKDNPNAELVLAGDGPLHEKLMNEAKDLGIIESVHFLGVRNDVNRLLQAFDAFVFPSLREGLPVSVVEAQAAGLHCFLSDTITDEVKITNLVKFISLDAGIEQWKTEIEATCFCGVEHPDLSKEICGAGFDIRQTAEKLCSLYEKS